MMAKKKTEKREDLRTAVKAYEKQYIRLMLNRHDWNKPETAKALDIGLSSLYRKINELKIDYTFDDTDAFTIIRVPEITKEDGCLYCSRCGTKLMLVISPAYWDVDDEAFKSGEMKPEDCPDEVSIGEVSGHFCSKCKTLTSLSYN